jgi:hypothetical protein
MGLFMILCIFIIWTWGLTPVWVNVVGTVLLGIAILYMIFGKDEDDKK